MRRSLRRIVTASLVVVLVSAAAGYRAVAALGQAAPQASQPSGVTPAGLAQIGSLLAEKRALTPVQRKINSRLLHAKRQLTGETSVTTMSVALPRAASGKVQLELRADVTDRLLAALGGLGVDVVATQAAGRSVLVDADLLEIERIAALPDVRFVQPKPDYFTSASRGSVFTESSVSSRDDLAIRRERKLRDRGAIIESVQAALGGQGHITNVGSVTSQGDVTHKAATARSTYGVNGTGIKVGVISDGVDGLATSQASGDLGAVTVLPLQAGSGAEGTAMLEIIHDLAPAAQLFFATADPTPAQFAQNIRDLRTAGCDIIVDDVGYFVETPFQDGQDPSVISNTNGGVVAQAVKDVSASGALYFSSAANSGNLDAGTSGTWEGDFVDGGPAADPILTFEGAPTRLHSFGATTFDVMTFTNVSGPVTLAWSDPLGASSNDYDIFILDNTGTTIFDSSTDTQNGTQDPFEQMGHAFPNERIVIVKFAGADRFLHLDTNRGRLGIATAGSTHGHATTTAPTSFSVAATPAATAFTLGAPTGPFPNPFNSTNVVEPFSSDGPRHIFFTSAGAALTPGNVSSTGGQVLLKPDITAADGVSVTGAGGFSNPFFGTSAAAPHAAAIAALIQSARPGITAAQVRTALLSSAIDIQAPGIDRDSGVGIVMADTAFASPRITASPVNQTIVARTTASLSVVADSLLPVTYQWHLGPSGVVNPIPLATASTFVTPPLDGLANYWVRVTNAKGSTDSSAATVAVTFTDATNSFTDATLTTGTTQVRAVHVLELRTRIDALRAAQPLPAFPWTDATLTVHTTAIKPVHINELRSALTDVYTARGLTSPTFTGAITTGTLIRALHIAELRDAVTALP